MATTFSAQEYELSEHLACLLDQVRKGDLTIGEMVVTTTPASNKAVVEITVFASNGRRVRGEPPKDASSELTAANDRPAVRDLILD